MRAVAAAGVAQELVAHYFGTKQQLFVEVVELPLDPGVAVPALFAALGKRLDNVEGSGSPLEAVGSPRPRTDVQRRALDAPGPVVLKVAQASEDDVRLVEFAEAGESSDAGHANHGR